MVPYKKKQLNGIFNLMIAYAYISVFKKSKVASFSLYNLTVTSKVARLNSGFGLIM